MTVNLNGDLSQWTMGAAAMPDMFGLLDTTAAVHTIARSADVPSRALCGRVIPYSMELTVATADASVAASDVTAITYRGEGSEACHLLGGPVRVRGWVKGLAGTYNLHLSNGAETLSYSQPITVLSADMWTRFDVGFPELPDPDGSWYLDNRVGYTVALALCVGAVVQSEMERWGSGLTFGGPQTNFNATAGNKIKLAGLRVGDGPLFYEAPEQTERDCMRYLESTFNRGVAPSQNLGWGSGELTLPVLAAGPSSVTHPVRYCVPKRKPASLTAYNPAASNAQARTFSHGDCTATAFDEGTVFGFRVTATTPAGTTVGEQTGVHWLADARLPALTQNVGG